ncbi:S8 family serine peptidase [Pelagicoccus sp. SDUM812005]|uniref:S8 family serine peptidase n=1 Tax=Pelagicoccus sp. SDUM812005 TaxID=3041257 RepID=UPI00280EF06B|nr:S8 family serine peptidase [Pelagicoccus sp. SDUM812005]MDQ8183746.1 S8 family serine peptidase [Pelagicoccus sp. SDUM812005]
MQAPGFASPVRVSDLIDYDEDGEQVKIRETSAYIANQVVLHSSSLLEEAEINDIVASLGWTYLESESSPYLAVIQSKDAEFETVENALLAISQSGSPLSAEPNYLFYATAIPDDPLYNTVQQWGLNNNTDFDINAPEAWELRKDAPSRIIAIIDSGIRTSHEDLSANIWRNAGEIAGNGRDDDGNGFADDVHGYNFISHSKPPVDDNGHGTHVAGIAGASGNNGKGVAGVAWKVQLMALKGLNAEGVGPNSALASAIDYATQNGAHVINASWGSETQSDAIDAAIGRAKLKGIPFVAAAGNEGASTLGFPANSSHENVLSVGSARSSGTRSSFSNYSNREVDVIAPGEYIYSTWNDSDSSYAALDGTSMAAPFVSGMLALCSAHFPDDSYLKQINRVIYSSKRVASFERFCRSGGLVNLENALKMVEVPIPPQLTRISSYVQETEEGQATRFEVQAEDDGPISYRWFHNGNLLSETTPALVFESTRREDRGTYTLEISNSEATISLEFQLFVFARMTQIEELLAFDGAVYASHEDHWELTQEDGEPAIVNKALEVNETAFLRIHLPDTGAIRFYAKKPYDDVKRTETSLNTSSGGRRIRGLEWHPVIQQTNRSEVNPVATLTHRAYYNSEHDAAETLFLRIPEYFEQEKTPPAISGDSPENWTLRIGSTHTFKLYYSRLEDDLSIQWYKDGMPISGANEDKLSITAQSKEDEGYYFATVSNEHGSTTSRTAYLTVDTSPLPAYIKSEYNTARTFLSGDDFLIEMEVFGTEPIQYQWYREGVAILGATQRDLNLGAASPAHAGYYHLLAWNESNEYPDQSDRYRVSVYDQINPPSFSDLDKQDKSWVTAENQGVKLIFNPPNGSDPLTYQWFKDDQPIGTAFGGTSFNIVYPKAVDSGSYFLKATNSLGSDESGRIHLTVTPGYKEAIELEDAYFVRVDNKVDRDDYLILQSAESWDGIDALEFSSPAQSHNWFDLRPGTEDATYRFRWKRSPGSAESFSCAVEGSAPLRLQESDEWQEATIFVPGDKSIAFGLRAGEQPAKVWIDAFEKVEAPALIGPVLLSYPDSGQDLILSPQLSGSNFTIKWFKNGTALAGKTSPSLNVGRLSQAVGTYRFEAENAHGKYSSPDLRIQSDILTRLVSEHVSLSFSENVEAKIEIPTRIGSEPALYFTSVSESGNYIDLQINGPGHLSLDYDLQVYNPWIRFGTRLISLDHDYDRNQQTIWVSSSATTARLSLGVHNGFQGKLHNIQLSRTPRAQIFLDFLQGTLSLKASYQGEEPLTVIWYKDGTEIKRESGLSSGESFLLDRMPTPSESGVYEVEVVDAEGESSCSGALFYGPQELASEVLDVSSEALTIQLEDGDYYFDSEVKVQGDHSLCITREYYHDWSRIINFGGAFPVFKISIKSEGFPAGSSIRYYSQEGWKTTPANSDWIEVEVSRPASHFEILLPKPDGPAKVWIDNAKPIRDYAFISHPQNVPTYLGSEAELQANAVAGPSQYLEIKWLRNGKQVGEGNRLFIESVSPETIGTYIACAEAPDGTLFYSRPAEVFLLDATELARAIGYPGARIKIEGHGTWTVNAEDALDGLTSIVSSPLAPGEYSRITIEIDDNFEWGIYEQNYTEENYIISQKEPWKYRPSSKLYNSETRRIEFHVFRNEYEIDETRRVRLDGIRTTRFSDRNYETWIRGDHAAGNLPSGLAYMDKSADPDKDGIPNWAEFALSLDPGIRDALPQWVFSDLEADELAAELTLLAGRSSDYSISYEGSYDLVNWFRIKPELSIDSSAPDYNQIRAAVPVAGENSPSLFVRWRIESLAEDGASKLSYRSQEATP